MCKFQNTLHSATKGELMRIPGFEHLDVCVCLPGCVDVGRIYNSLFISMKILTQVEFVVCMNMCLFICVCAWCVGISHVAFHHLRFGLSFTILSF